MGRKVGVRDSSLTAYRSLDLTEGQRRVMRVFHLFPDETFTRAEIAQRGQIPLQSVCGRVAELIPHYLEELKARPCRVTGNPSHPLRIKSPGAAFDQGPSRRMGQQSTAAPVAPSMADTPSASPLPAAAVPDEQMFYDEKGKPFYIAAGRGPGWPPDQDRLHKGRR